MVIKNIMDIHANWKWGNILPIKSRNKDKTEKEILEENSVLEAEEGMMTEEDVSIMKFPSKDPRISQELKKNKVAEVQLEGSSEVIKLEVPKVAKSKKDKKSKEVKAESTDKKDTDIRRIESQKVADEEDKKDSVS